MNRVTIRTKKKNKGTMLSVFLEYNPAFVNPKGVFRGCISIRHINMKPIPEVPSVY